MRIDAYCPAAVATGQDTSRSVIPGLTDGRAEDLAAWKEDNIYRPVGFFNGK
jgi:hypothetical protein